MDPQKLGLILLSAVAIGVGIYDIFAALFMPTGSTVSILLFALARNHPILPFAFGTLIGHLFWPQQ